VEFYYSTFLCGRSYASLLSAQKRRKPSTLGEIPALNWFGRIGGIRAAEEKENIFKNKGNENMIQNIAYTNNYSEYRKLSEFLFDTKSTDIENYTLGDNEYLVKDIKYSKVVNENGIDHYYGAKKTIIYDTENHIILETKSIDNEHFNVALIKHQNGQHYFIVKIDLYGYSIFDKKDKKIIHFIPREVIDFNETFIWVETKYCNINNVLAVSGCYWACPCGVEFYDFSEPTNVPLKQYCTNEYLTNIFNIDNNEDVDFEGFTDNGECIIHFTDKNGKKCIRNFDVVKLYAQKCRIQSERYVP
jgi:ribonuclease HI